MTSDQAPDGDGHEGFDAVVGPYARTRPGYPAEALDWLGAHVALGRGSRVLDLAAGTGKLTVSLVARGATVTAVEPLPGMRAQLERDVPAARALDGRAEAIPLGDGTVDVVCVGQAFHWFEPRQALDEIVRVLVPGGSLALCWNLWDLTDEAQAALDAIVTPLETARIRHLTTRNHPYGSWSGALAADRRLAWVASERFAHTVDLDASEAAQRVASMSQVQSAPRDVRDAAIAEAGDVVRRMPGGRGSFRYQTEIDVWRRDA